MLAEVALGVLIAGFVVSFVLAFGIGANDVANSMGTSVGAKVMSLRTACYLATVMEISGSVLIGYKVSDTIRKGIVSPDVYEGHPEEFMLGNLSALGASAIWLILATFLKMPISGTHSIVGSVLGFSLVARGTDGIDWWKLGSIVGSWFVSPVLSGLVSGAIFFGINRFIIRKEDAITPGLRSLPIFYGVTIFINLISILLDGPDMFKIKTSLPDWTEPVFGLLISLGISLIVATVVVIWMVPKLRREITDLARDQSPINPPDEKKLNNGFAKEFIPELGEGEKKHSSGTVIITTNEKNVLTKGPPSLEVIPMDGVTPNSSGTPLIKPAGSDIEISYRNGINGIMSSKDTSPARTNSEDEDEGIIFPKNGKKEDGDRPGVGKLFSFLQILTAAFGSFAHGGNDVSNAIGPLIALWLVYKEGIVDTVTQTPIWLLIYGGVGISLGLWVWGRRVIKTMGEDLTKITPSSGFTIEIGAAITVLLASKIGIPVSTTHCKVGSVVFVGWIRSSKDGVDWSLFRNIIFAWVVTVPVSGGLSALLMWFLKSVAL